MGQSAITNASKSSFDEIGAINKLFFILHIIYLPYLCSALLGNRKQNRIITRRCQAKIQSPAIGKDLDNWEKVISFAPLSKKPIFTN